MPDKKSIPPGPPMTRASNSIPQNTRKTQANIQSPNIRVVQEGYIPISTKLAFDSANNDKNKK